MTDSEAISPGLFDFVERAIEQISRESVTGRLSPTAPIREFLENFFAQFFKNVLEAEPQPISASGALEARRMERLGTATPLSAERRTLLHRFLKVCKLDPDLRGGDYGGGLRANRDFHETFVPDLLDEISQWASTEGIEELASRASESAASYRQVVQEAFQ